MVSSQSEAVIDEAVKGEAVTDEAAEEVTQSR